MRKILVSLFLGMALSASAQVAITATHVDNAFEQPLTAGRLCFTPVNAAASPTGFRVGSIQVVQSEVCGNVTVGILQSGLTLAPNPTGIYYHVYVKGANSNVVVQDYGMASITGSTWTLDTFDPNFVTLPVSAVSYGTTTLLSPGSGASCNITGSTGAYLLNCSIPGGATGATGATGPTFTGGTVTGIKASDTHGNWFGNGFSSIATGFTNNTVIGNGAAPLYGTGTPGAGNFGLTVLGQGAYAAGTSGTGSTVLGYDAMASYVGDGSGNEDGDAVAIGWNACGNATVLHEVICIGHSAMQNGNNESNSVIIGTHIYQPSQGFQNTYIGDGITQSFLGFVKGTQSTIVGANIFSNTGGVSATVYNAVDESIFGSWAGQCWMNTSNNTIIGMAAATLTYPAPSACSAFPTAQQDVIISPGPPTPGTAHNPGGAITSGSFNTIIGGQNFGGTSQSTAQSLTTGQNDVIIGGAAAGSMTTAANSTVVGNGAAYADTTVEVDAFGYQALFAQTTAAGNVAFGFEAGHAVTTGNHNTFLGFEAGMNDTSSSNTYVGLTAGQNVSGGTNTAMGVFAGPQGNAGTETGTVMIGYNAKCTNCTNSEILGAGGNIGTSATGAAQIGSGTNSTNNTMQFQTINFLNNVGDHWVHGISQYAANNTGGTCAMATSTSCTITLAHTYTTPVCIVTPQGTTTGNTYACSVSGTTVTITASASNSLTWGALVFGNPN